MRITKGKNIRAIAAQAAADEAARIEARNARAGTMAQALRNNRQLMLTLQPMLHEQGVTILTETDKIMESVDTPMVVRMLMDDLWCVSCRHKCSLHSEPRKAYKTSPELCIKPMQRVLEDIQAMFHKAPRERIIEENNRRIVMDHVGYPSRDDSLYCGCGHEVVYHRSHVDRPQSETVCCNCVANQNDIKAQAHTIKREHDARIKPAHLRVAENLATLTATPVMGPQAHMYAEHNKRLMQAYRRSSNPGVLENMACTFCGHAVRQHSANPPTGCDACACVQKRSDARAGAEASVSLAK